MSTPSDPVGPSDSRSPEVVLVKTSSNDPITSLRAVSVDPSHGRLLAVLATSSREGLDRQLSEAERRPEDCRVVEFVRRDDPQRRTVDGYDERLAGDLAGLSMEVAGQLGWLTAGGNGVIYLDSIEPYVSVAGLESTFRFLVIVAAQARSRGVTFVAGLEPDALDPVSAGTLTEAFDRIVEQGPTSETGDTG